MLDNLTVETVSRSRRGEVDFDNLGFGGVYADHIFRMDYSDGDWHSPRIVPYGPLGLEPGVASLHYGQSVFEGLKAYRGGDGRIRLFRPDANARRLRDSCERLCLPQVDEDLFVEAVRRLVQLDHAWVPAQRGQSLYIRPLVLGTEQHLEVRPSRRCSFIIMTAPARAYFTDGGDGIGLQVQEGFTRAAPGGTGFAKTGGNYAASLLPGDHSRAAGYQQALWLDGVEHRYVEEVGQMNIFFKFREHVVTPDLHGTILPGVTRDSLLTLLQAQGHAVEQRRVTIDEVIDGIASGELEEAFGAGTAAVVTPVGRIGFRGQDLSINGGRCGALTASLYQAITALQYGEVSDPYGWTRVVEPLSQRAPA